MNYTMLTRSQYKTRLFEVNIDFDQVSEAWKSNKNQIVMEHINIVIFFRNEIII